MDITLASLLAKVSQKLPLLTYISTRNPTFPKECRYSKIFAWELENSLPKEMLNQTVKCVNSSKTTLMDIMQDRFEAAERPLYLSIEIY